MRDPEQTEILPPLVLVRAGLAVFSIERDLVTNEDVAKWARATGRALSGWVEGAARAPALGLAHDDASAYAQWRGMRLPTESEWAAAAKGAVASTGLSDLGVRGLLQSWEWTSTPMKKGFVVCGGRYRDRADQPGGVLHRSWEDTGGPDVGFRCAIEGEPTVIARPGDVDKTW